MSYQSILQQISQKQTVPVYLLYGTEPYFIQELQKKITKTIVPDEETEAIVHYDLTETPIQDVLADAQTYPLFSERKVIIARNPVFLKAKLPKLVFEHDIEMLKQYLDDPVSFTVIIFIAPYEKIDERKKISKALKKKAAIALCQPMREKETADWIHDYMRELDIRFDPDVSDMLEAEFSGNLAMLKNEMDKYALYAGDGGYVTYEAAEELTVKSMNHSSLRLADAVMEKNLHQALAIGKDLLKMNEEPIALIALLAFQFRTVLRVKLLKQEGYTETQITKQMKAHPYVVKIAMKREKKFKKHHLESIIDMLTNADETMKQGEMEKQLAFELLLYNLIESVA